MFAKAGGLAGHAFWRLSRKTGVVLLAFTVSLGGLLIPQRVLATDTDAHEPDDAYTTATAITVDGGAQQHTIAPVGDEDWISFSVSTGETYVIETASGTPVEDLDTELELYDSDGTTFLDYDDDGGSGAYSRIEYTADANETLYVRVNEYGDNGTGAYSITVMDVSDDYEPDDSYGAATPITVDAEAQQHTINPDSDEDWVSFAVSTDMTYRIITTSGTPAIDFDAILTLYDSNGTSELADSDENWSTPDEVILYTATASKTVYVRVQGWGAGETGSYALSVESVGDTYEPDGSYSSATPITVSGAAQEHDLDPYGDQDWVSFPVAEGLTYRVWTELEGDYTRVALFDSDGTTEIETGYAEDTYFDWEADATKTIYARITGHFANEGDEYEVSVFVISDAYEPDDSFGSAGSVTVNGAAQDRNLLPSDESDWVELSVTRGWKYTIQTGPGDPVQDTDTTLELYESDGTTEIDYDDDSGADMYSRIEYIAEADATLYVRISGYSHSDSTYSFWVSAVPVPVIDITESVDYGTVLVGSGLQKTVTISNVGAAPLIIGDVELIGDDFAITSANPSGESIAADDSWDVGVTYSPSAAYSGDPDPVKHSWTSLIAEYNYVGGSLYSISLFTGFENLGGGGDLDWHVRVGGADSYGDHPVVAGGKYIVKTVVLKGSGTGLVEVVEPVTENYQLNGLLGSFLSCSYIRVPDATLSVVSNDSSEPTATAELFGSGGDPADPNNAPVAVADSYETAENTQLQVAASGVLANDTDAEDDDLTAVKVSDPAHGTVVLNADGSFTYTPTTGYSGSDSFTYKANDGALDSNVVAVSITVVPEGETILVPIAGSNRYSTAVEASKEAYPTGGSVDTVVIATGENWPDALGGAALAGVVDGPLLLTRPGYMASYVTDEIDRLGAENAYILGGTGAVSQDVEDDLNGLLSGTVTRLAGTSRYSTARDVADEVITLQGVGYSGDAFVVTGLNFPDALGASPLSAAWGDPILLVKPDQMPSLPPEVDHVTILGGTAVVTDTTEGLLDSALGGGDVYRIGGSNRYDTAAQVAQHGVDHGMYWDGVGIATGLAFPDALSGGAMLGSMDSVMLLTKSTSLVSQAQAKLETNKAQIDVVHFVGGTSAVSDSVREAVEDALE